MPHEEAEVGKLNTTGRKVGPSPVGSEMRPTVWTSPKKQKKGRRWRKLQRKKCRLKQDSSDDLICFDTHTMIPSQDKERHSLTVTGQLNGVAVRCLVDTGSVISLISQAIFQRIPETERTTLRDVRDEYHGVDGGLLTVHGKFDGVLTFGHTKVSQELMVVETDAEVILGMNFLIEQCCRLDLPKGILYLKSEKLNCWDDDPDHAHFRVINAKEVKIPPHTVAVVAGKLERIGEVTEWGIIEPNPDIVQTSGVLTGRTVITTKQNQVPVRVCNCNAKPVILQPNTLLGWCESVHWCEEGPHSEPSISDEERGPAAGWSCSVKKKRESRETEIPAHLVDLFERSSTLLEDDEKLTLACALMTYENIFSKGKEDIGRTGLVKHTIDVGQARAIKQPPRRLPFAKRQVEKEEVNRMLQQGVIEPSTSPWASPVVLVTKKDGTVRFCVDYRKLNAVTIKDAYPLPRVDDCLDSLAGSQWFSTMDLSSGYWQVEMADEDKEKTAFVTRSGLYHFRVMAFGLANAPATFERLMEGVMRGMQWEECLIYLDDIISFGRTFDEQLERLIKIFKRLEQAGLKLKPSKCSLFQDQVEFLGHIISKEGVTPNPEKIEAVLAWPPPENVREVRSFLGLCSYYRRFVEGYAAIAKPLQALVKKDVPYSWTTACAEAFQRLKTALTQSPVLAYPLENAKFILDTDASQDSVGAVLSQVQQGQEKVVAYYSRTLNVHERQYCITRKEMLAVVCAVRKFKSYLWGRYVKLRTDNAAVSYMMRIKEPEGQLARWLEELSSYDLDIAHRAGHSHRNADALSRRPCRQCGRDDESDTVPAKSSDKEKYCAVVTRQKKKQGQNQQIQTGCWLEGWDETELRDSQLRDHEIGLIMRVIDTGGERPVWAAIAGESSAVQTLWGQWKRLAVRDGVLYRKAEVDNEEIRWQTVVPQEMRRQVLHHCHDTPPAGHMGVARTTERVKQSFFWVGIKKDVRQYCRECDCCTARKLPNGAPKVPMKSYITGTPMTRVAVDVLGPLTETERGNRYILVLGDYFSKWTVAVPLPNQEAKMVAKAMVEEWICQWGAPRFVHSDQGRNFESELFSQLMEMLEIKKTRTTPLHPQSNGMVERFNKTLLRILTIYAKDCHRSWDEYTKFACMAYNSSVHSTTGFTPHKLLFGREMRLPVHVLTGNPSEEEDAQDMSTHDDYQTYVDDLKEKLKKTHTVALKAIKHGVKLYKDRYDVGLASRQLHVGQPVWLYRPQRKKGVCPKLTCKWEKGYVVIQQLDDMLYRVQKGRQGRSQVVHIQRLVPYGGTDPPMWWKPNTACRWVGRWTGSVHKVHGKSSY